MMTRSRMNRCAAYVIGVACAMIPAAFEARAEEVKLDERVQASFKAAHALEKEVIWGDTPLLAVQHLGRYKPLEAFSRESISAMHGSSHLPELTPLGSMFEWLFNREAYLDAPLVKVKEAGLRMQLVAHLPVDAPQRIRILTTGMMTPRELADQSVQLRLRELGPRPEMGPAMGRIRNAETVANFLERIFNIVPDPSGDAIAPWHTPLETLGSLGPEVWQAAGVSPRDLEERLGRVGVISGMSPAQAMSVMIPWAKLSAAWKKRDATGVNAALRQLETALPALAPAGVYPSKIQRQAEAIYYQTWKFTFAWVVYLLGAIIGVWALVTPWKTPRYISMGLLLIAILLHLVGIALRWYIIGRIPVANMFEAIVGAAWMGIVAAFVLEWIYKRRVFAFAANVAGFAALMIAQHVLPGSGDISTIRAILDDVMLRIHTTMIIASYALIFIGGVIAVVYLFGYYQHTAPGLSALAGLIVAAAGLVVMVAEQAMFEASLKEVTYSGFVKHGLAGYVAAGATIMLCSLIPVLISMRVHGFAHVVLAIPISVAATLMVGNHGFVQGMQYTMIGGGLGWSALAAAGFFLGRNNLVRPAAELAYSGGGAGRPRGGRFEMQPVAKLAGAGGGALAVAGSSAAIELFERPILAGGMPGDERSNKLPDWLNAFDWCHLIILNLVFVLLFVGTILGAVWADYSWGRPWGWDPKEVFAMNTWIIYAILIHVRFVVKQRGLWTAWLSVAGCLMMAFNWCVVNFFIVGLHSYA
ncbi:MAG: cytochrome c biogenesis protein CcsA [Phycisphaerales bacterium]|nr:cytochrome c biogenesis protein CcsA [Phycisphaerales bacterium]